MGAYLPRWRAPRKVFVGPGARRRLRRAERRLRHSRPRGGSGLRAGALQPGGPTPAAARAERPGPAAAPGDGRLPWRGGWPSPPGAGCPSIATGSGSSTRRRTYSLAYSPDVPSWRPDRGPAAERSSLAPLRRSASSATSTASGARPTTLAFSPDAKLLATAGGYLDSGALSRQPEGRQGLERRRRSLVRTIPAHCGYFAEVVAFSHDGTLLVTAGARARSRSGASPTARSWPAFLLRPPCEMPTSRRTTASSSRQRRLPGHGLEPAGGRR